MDIERIHKLTEKVLYCLEKNPATRNDDALLTINIIQTYLPDEVMDREGRLFISARALLRVREDAVKRIRAKIQNEEGRFLPTSEAVRKARKISEEAWFTWSKTQ